MTLSSSSDTAKIVYLFPGQGAQYPGMGERPPELRSVLEAQREILTVEFGWNPDVMMEPRLGAELHNDITAQVAVYLVSAGFVRLLKDRKIIPWCVCGYSSGLYSALLAAECYEWETGLRLTLDAGRYIESLTPRDGAVAAIIGLSVEAVEAICEEVRSKGDSSSSVGISHINESHHILIAGARQAVETASERARLGGAALVKLLPMTRAYHTEMMKDAALRFQQDLEVLPLRSPICSVLDYREVGYLGAPEGIRRMIGDHFTRKVEWMKSMLLLISDGAELFVEIGPGRSLGRILRRLNPTVKVVHAEDLIGRR